MTIHSAKGLEFSTVFVVGLEENIFPSPMATSSARELEEERRLLYVAITRAEKHCILTCARNRWRYGKMEYDTPSRFLRDIDPALLNVESERGGMDSSIDTDYTARYSGHTSRYSSIYNQSKPKEVHLTQSHSNQNLRRVVPSSATASTVSSSMVSTNAGNLSVGSIIEHQRFGIGVVQKLEGTGENTKATVEFKNAGTKQLLLKFARFSIVG
jgi:DNA helicase-2/ATP-dependent DNA helicase PcrA